MNALENSGYRGAKKRTKLAPARITFVFAHDEKTALRLAERFCLFRDDTLASICLVCLQLLLFDAGNECFGNLLHIAIMPPHTLWMPLYAYV